MNYRPRCQHCRSTGTRGPFSVVTLTVEWAQQRDLDPARTARMGFVCKDCGETFPAFAYSRKAPTSIICNVIERGVPWAGAEGWFATTARADLGQNS